MSQVGDDAFTPPPRGRIMRRNANRPGGLMRRTATALLAAAGLTVAGCGSTHTDGKPKPKTTATVSKEMTYLAVAHGIQFNGTPPTDDLLALPPKWCKALDAGHSVKWMFDSSGNGGGLYPWGPDWGTAQADADTLLVAGVKGWCPRNLDEVKKELRASGGY